MSSADLDTDEILCGWTIYKSPPEFPNHYAVQMWMVEVNGFVSMTQVAVLCETLEEARTQIPLGTVKFERDENDHPMIVETYI